MKCSCKSATLLQTLYETSLLV